VSGTKNNRVTRRTDSHGRVKEMYLDPWDRQQLENARRAGIPERMLDSAGSDDWRATGTLLGLWAEWVYVLSDCLRGEDHLGNPRRDNLRIVEEVFAWMHKTAQSLGVDPDQVIPWDVWSIRRELSPLARSEERTPGEVEAAQEAGDDMAQVVEGVFEAWGAPSGPEHDSRGHGKGPNGWICFPEEPE
jgi:hypothetical protein